jgi:hypothetical protein
VDPGDLEFRGGGVGVHLDGLGGPESLEAGEAVGGFAGAPEVWDAVPDGLREGGLLLLVEEPLDVFAEPLFRGLEVFGSHRSAA